MSGEAAVVVAGSLAASPGVQGSVGTPWEDGPCLKNDTQLSMPRAQAPTRRLRRSKQ